MGVGRLILADMLMGFGSGMAGQPFQSARETLIQREFLKQKLNQERNSELMDFASGLLDYSLKNRQLDEAALTRQVGLTETITEELGAQTRQELGHEQKLVEQADKAQLDLDLARLKETIIKSDLDSQISQFTTFAHDPQFTTEEQAAWKARRDELQADKLAMLKESEEIKARVAASWRAPVSNVGTINITKSDEFGTWHEVGFYNNTDPNATIRHTMPVGDFTIHDDWRDDLRAAERSGGLLKQISDNYSAVGEDGAPLVRDEIFTAIGGKIQSALGVAEKLTRSDVLKMFSSEEEQKLSLNPTEAQLFQNIGKYLISNIIEASGKQVTNQEREFVQTTLPSLFQNRKTFGAGIEILRLQTDWTAARIRSMGNSKTRPLFMGEDSIGNPTMKDASEVFSFWTNQITTGRLSVRQLRTFTVQDILDRLDGGEAELSQ